MQLATLLVAVVISERGVSVKMWFDVSRRRNTSRCGAGNLDLRRSLLVCGMLVAFEQQIDAGPLAPGTAAKREVAAAERLQVLEMLAVQIRGNYERIVTWSGSYRFNDRFRFNGEIPRVGGMRDEVVEMNREGGKLAPLNSGEIPVGAEAGGGHWEIMRGVARFAWDKESDSYHVFYQPTEQVGFIDVPTGKGARWPILGHPRHWTFTPEHALEFDTEYVTGPLPDYPNVATVPPNGNGRIVYRQTVREGRTTTRIVNARDFLSNGSYLFFRNLELYTSALRGKRTDKEKQLVQDGVEIFLDKGPPPAYTVVAKYYRDGAQDATTYDSGVGFNAVHWVDRSGTGQILDERRIRYRSISGIFVPEFVSLTRCKEISGSVRPTAIRTFELLNCELNKDIPTSEFGVEPFKLAYGERMLDKINKQLMVYDGAGFVPAEEFVPRSSEDSNGGSARIYLLVANAVVVLAIIGLLVYRRYARQVAMP